MVIHCFRMEHHLAMDGGRWRCPVSSRALQGVGEVLIGTESVERRLHLLLWCLMASDGLQSRGINAFPGLLNWYLECLSKWCFHGLIKAGARLARSHVTMLAVLLFRDLLANQVLLVY
jgi:hypothetical protein